MTERDVWRWIIPKFDNELLLFIYQSKQINCSGFRTNTIKEIKANRNRLISNLLSKNNYTKLSVWSKAIPPNPTKEIVLADKEINELAEIAKETNAVAVIMKLFYEKQDKKAIQFFSFLQKEKNELLEIPNESIGIEEDESSESDKKNEVEQKTKKLPETPKKEKENEHVVSKKELKRLEQLETKTRNLMKQLENQSSIHKKKMEELRGNNQKLTSKLEEKNRLYNALLKEQDRITDKHKEEENKWNKDRDEYEKTIQEMQDKLNHFYAKQLHEETTENTNTKVSNDYTIKLNLGKKYKILVIGKPANTKPFNKEEVDFVFVEENQVHNYPFSIEYDKYWILSYELSNKDQFLLHANNSYSNIESNKVTICKNFNEVKHLLKHYTDVKERVM